MIGCQLTIQNGRADSFNMPGFLLITYTCNPGYRFPSGTNSLIYGCTDGIMAVKPPPCESESSDNIFMHTRNLPCTYYITTHGLTITLFLF